MGNNWVYDKHKRQKETQHLELPVNLLATTLDTKFWKLSVTFSIPVMVVAAAVNV